jgi:hypothetical protein
MNPGLMAAALTAALTLALPAVAHHSGAMFDRSQVAMLEGEVHEWRWSNPHSWLQVQVTNEAGEQVLWSLEATSQQILARQGWRRTSLVPGEKISVYFNPFRDGAPGGNLVAVMKSDGTVLGQPPRALSGEED